MLYYTNKARETAQQEIARLIPIIATIPADNLNYNDASAIIHYLAAMKDELQREIKTESKIKEIKQ